MSEREMIKSNDVVGLVRALSPKVSATTYEIKMAFDALKAMGEPAVLPLIEGLKDPDDAARYNAAKCLGEIGDARAVEPLVACMQDCESNGWFAIGQLGAIRALAKMGDSRAQDALTFTSKNGSSAQVCTDAAMALEAIRSRS